MASSVPIVDLVAALQERRFPSITTWNRLEARPRTVEFDRVLRAEVRDPLWMLTKQWQMGEFRGSDAGSPVFAKLQMDTTRLTKYRPDALGVQPFDYATPLEAKVERRPIPLTMKNRPMALDVRLAMGRRWLKLIADLDPAYRQAFIDAYPIVPPTKTKADANISAHPDVLQSFAALAGRALDGGALYLYLRADPSHHAYDVVAGIALADHGAIDARATRFLSWVERQFLQPPASGDDAWLPEKLEYQFAASAPRPDGTEKVYVAEEYYQGRLDWFSLDVDAGTTALDPVAGSEVTGLPPDAPQSMIPTAVSFGGMPNTRWWAFEDRKTNFGEIDAATTDLAKLLFMEFALVYANDWFVIPCTLPAGTIAAIRGMVVTNVFGERFWIDAAGKGANNDWQRWAMFTIDVHGQKDAPADTSLLLLPTVGKIQESAPLEEIMLVRDEVANMVWGIETLVPMPTGGSKRGAEAATQTRSFLTGLIGTPPPPPPAAAPIRYTVMTDVPENWIPFIPVHVPNDNRDIQIQRAAMPRILPGDPDPPVKVEPRTTLLRHGLDDGKAYFIFEEEVPRAGTRLSQMYERTRWTDGRVYTWLRVRKQTGRGEGASKLAFDQLVDVPVAPKP